MEKIALEFTYEKYILSVPSDIAKDIKKIQRAFDKWLYDKSNNHGLWIVKNGRKAAVQFDASDFADFINRTYLNERKEKAKITEEVTEVPAGVPVLYF
ncbi:MAG: hypothetical protein IJR90_05385 [Clostridia bacterium]|nr:hypothetical protein [Clostridia bacterium]